MASRKNIKFKYYVSYLIVAVALILFTVLQLTGGLKRSTANLLAEIGYSVILAVSLNLVVGFLGELSLGHAGFMCIGAYLGTLFMKVFSGFIPSQLVCLIISMILGGLCAAFFGFIVGLPALRLKGDYLAIVTLAFGEIVRNLFKNLPWFGGAMGYTSKGYGSTLFIIAFVAILVMLFAVQNLVRSKHGRAITAIRDNEIAARATGINVTYYKLIVFVIAAFFAGVAGVIYANYTTPILYSFFSYNYSIEILVMVVLGSMGSITGSILAASFLTCVNFYLKTHLSGDMAALKYLVYALILMIVVIFGNAPALRSFREKYNPKVLFAKFFKKKPNPAAERNDAGSWDRIPTKIKMDELLTVDVKSNESVQDPDKGEK
ncbi:MAG: branched-chain amino acid ABC transporter permease [Clostridia bacterium]|nr:branched-chain amino acid ABC transporter permease [Clostridia bacterium]